MNTLTFDECRSRANDALSTLEGYSTSKEDLERCLKDWYDRGHNYCLLKGGIRHAYRRMPKKPWASKEWVSIRDVKLYQFMADKVSPSFWENVWGTGSLIPHSPKYSDIDDNFYKMCRREIEKM